MLKTKSTLVMFSVVVVLSLVATAGVGAQEVRNPDTFVVGHFGEPETLDPAWMYDTSSAAVASNVYEGLLAFERDDADAFVPALAKTWEVSNNGLTWSFEIQEGVKFHEGGTLEPHDVAYSFQRGMLQDRLDGPQSLFLEPFFGVGTKSILDAVNKVGQLRLADTSTLQLEDYPDAAEDVCKMVQEVISYDDAAGTVTMRLMRPTAWLPQLLAQTWGSVLDEEWMIEQGDWDGDCTTWTKWYDPAAEMSVLFDKMNGTGPYKFDRWDKGEEIVLVANEDYWRTKPIWKGGPSGVAAIERVSIKLVEEWGTRFAMLQAGDLDYGDVDQAYYSQVQPLVKTVYLDGVEEGKSMKGNPDGTLLEFRNLREPFMTGAMMNFAIDTQGGNPFIGSAKLDGDGIPPDFFADIHVRKAFNYAFDWDAFINDALVGEGVQPKGPIIADMLGYDPDQPTYAHDMDKATEEFKLAWDGELWEKGFRVQISYNMGDDVRRIAADVLKANVEAINPKFQIEILNLPWPTFLQVRTEGKLPILISGWQEDYHDPSNWVQPFMSSSGAYARAQHFPKGLAGKYDELIDRGLKTIDPIDREPIYQELQNLAYEDAITIFLYQAVRRRYFQSWVTGWYFNPLYPEPYAFIYALSK